MTQGSEARALTNSSQSPRAEELFAKVSGNILLRATLGLEDHWRRLIHKDCFDQAARCNRSGGRSPDTSDRYLGRKLCLACIDHMYAGHRPHKYTGTAAGFLYTLMIQCRPYLEAAGAPVLRSIQSQFLQYGAACWQVAAFRLPCFSSRQATFGGNVCYEGFTASCGRQYGQSINSVAVTYSASASVSAGVRSLF